MRWRAVIGWLGALVVAVVIVFVAPSMMTGGSSDPMTPPCCESGNLDSGNLSTSDAGLLNPLSQRDEQSLFESVFGADEAQRIGQLPSDQRSDLIERLRRGGLINSDGAAPTRDAAIKAAIANFKETPFRYNRPETLNYNVPNEIVLSIASNNVEAAASAVARGTGPIQAGEAKLGTSIRASLDGPPSLVDISLAHSPGDPSPVRAMTSESNLTWTWHVVPKTLNEVTLTLSIFNNISINGEMVEIEGPAYTDTFTIKASFWERWSPILGSVWAQLLAIITAGAAIFGVVHERSKRRQERLAGEAGTGDPASPPVAKRAFRKPRKK